ncbi:hypothetical protein DFP72DRAFT_1044931 [Ephemerocybe angulata]|uniref:Fe2OG dioxygenase domain-containing protein n=1 Tax=Ephemerocybe angulata TaxID=980116 RepID=A0A8H6M693_9AGAR|nr:hypothetical protein DFP72DRAFT_1044931 [Tulosesus angulatus]
MSVEAMATAQELEVPQTVQTPTEDDSEEEYDGDLNNDLHDALSGDFKFTGNFYHRSTDANAPNPGLTVEGLGLIGLPLSERDAKLLISRAAQAPFGKGDQTVIDTDVRDTWEIEPANVSFANPKWKEFIDQTAFKTVWATLGVAPYTTMPRCELYKLLLYQEGSHFLPHQDTEKANGMFATIVVVLPSAFEGGQLHVSHGGRSAVIDVAQNSAWNTSILAWYTDVMHEVKPITSGYRLALSYNLIHTSPNTPQPSLPNEEGVMDDLRQTLERWDRDMYDEMPDPPLYAYMLSHQYSQNDLNRGAAALKGRDAHLVAHLRPVAEELGFSVCLANLKRTESGCADDCGYNYNKRGRYGRGWYDSDEDEDEDEHVTMLEVEDSSMELSNVVRLEENGPKNMGLGTFALDSEALVPRNAFEDLEPDDQEYEGYMGNGAGGLEQWYNRSALVLFRKEDETDIIMSVSGPAAVLRNLEVTDTPTPTAQQVVNSVLAKLSDAATAATIIRHALAWKQNDVWNKAIPYIGPSLEAVSSEITRALDVFDLDSIKPGLAQLVKKRAGLQQRLEVVKAIVAYLGNAADSDWVEELTKEALSTYKAASVADVGTLVRIAQERGVGTLQTVVLPKLAAQAGTYEFHVTLAKALNQHAKQLTDSDPKTIQNKGEFEGVVRQCIRAAIAQWDSVVQATAPHANHYMLARPAPALSPTVKTERINNLVQLSFEVQDTELCVAVFNGAGVQHRMEVMTAIRGQIGCASPEWVKELGRTSLSSYSTPAVSDVPTLSWISQELGAEGIRNLVVQKVPKSGTYAFLIALAKSLHERRSLLSRVPETTDQTKTEFAGAISQCLLSAVPQWEQGIPTPPVHGGYPYHGYRAAPVDTGPALKVQRIIEIVEFCFTIGDLKPCSRLFTLLLEIPANVKVDDRTLSLSTLREFSAQSLWLSPPPSQHAPLAAASASGPVQARRTHLEREIAQARIPHLISTETVRNRGSPYTLVVSKRPEVMGGLNWKEAQTKAVAFIRSVADDKGLKELMPDRYEDVLRAVAGSKVFVVGAMTVADPDGIAPTTPAAATAASGTTAPSASSSTVASAPAAGASAPVAGAKRKQRDPPKNTIAFIDLT